MSQRVEDKVDHDGAMASTAFCTLFCWPLFYFVIPLFFLAVFATLDLVLVLSHAYLHT
jgi:hypothetical protein